MAIAELKEQVLDSAKYFTYPWLAGISEPISNKYIKLEREEKPMKKNLKEKMYDEMSELTEKIHKLDEFRESDGYAYLNEEDKELVSAQINAMNAYYRILNIRYRRLRGEYK